MLRDARDEHVSDADGGHELARFVAGGAHAVAVMLIVSGLVFTLSASDRQTDPLNGHC
jgi:hypothetical protein